ncbi:MAG: CHRD domain-containing protein [Sulfuriferula multivorans]|uniref:CHRD domain-containing protein n=1 Tax=Sulfuriferula multivorans TaxID=1559896 RepID=A0A7C9NSZ4_9PROT|nr:CHRD domain-containing protein [Sulfuriferula multivorans]
MKMKSLLSGFGLLVVSVSPLAAHAEILQFNALLNSANSVPALTNPNTAASGLSTLFYDTLTNTYDFTLSAFSLSGSVTGMHIHGPANTTQSGGVLVDINMAPFQKFNSGSTLLLGGDDVTSFGFVASANGHPGQSFLNTLNSGLTYVNIHTAMYPGGEIRGQLLPSAVAAVPEPQVWASLLVGMGLVGFVTRRRLRTRAL